MELDIKNGRISFGDFQIPADFSPREVKNLNKKIDIQQLVENAKVSTYQLPDLQNGEFALTIIFMGEKLQCLSIQLGKKFNFPPFEITSDEKHILKCELKKLGGSKNYAWGKVEMVEDLKGGSVSIVISYN